MPNTEVNVTKRVQTAKVRVIARYHYLQTGVSSPMLHW
jgi:hypothetical protein